MHRPVLYRPSVAKALIKVFQRGTSWRARRKIVKKHLKHLFTDYGKRLYIQNRLSELSAEEAATEKERRKKHEFEEFLGKKLARYYELLPSGERDEAAKYYGQAYEKRGMLEKAAEAYLRGISYPDIQRIVNKMQKKRMYKEAANYLRKMGVTEEYRRIEQGDIPEEQKRAELWRAQAEGKAVDFDLLEKAAEMEKKVGNYDEALAIWTDAENKAHGLEDKAREYKYVLMQANLKKERGEWYSAGAYYIRIGKTKEAEHCAKKLSKRNPHLASGLYRDLGFSAKEGKMHKKAHRYVDTAKAYINPGGKSDLAFAKRNMLRAQELITETQRNVRDKIESFRNQLDERMRHASAEEGRVLRAAVERLKIVLQGDPSAKRMVDNLKEQFADYSNRLLPEVEQQRLTMEMDVDKLLSQHTSEISSSLSRAKNYIDEATEVVPKKLKEGINKTANAISPIMGAAGEGNLEGVHASLNPLINEVGAAEMALETVSKKNIRRGIKIAERLEKGTIVKRGMHRGRRLRRLDEALRLREFFDEPEHHLAAGRIAERMNKWEKAIEHYRAVTAAIERMAALPQDEKSKKLQESAKLGIARIHEMSGDFGHALTDYTELGLKADMARVNMKLGNFNTAAELFAELGAEYKSKGKLFAARRMRMQVARCFELAGEPRKALDVLRRKPFMPEIATPQPQHA